MRDRWRIETACQNAYVPGVLWRPPEQIHDSEYDVMHNSGTLRVPWRNPQQTRAMAEISCLSEEDLLRRSARGDEEAFTILYRRCHPPVYRFALHMGGSVESAEEITQDVFLALIRDPGRFHLERGRLIPFLLGIARNLALRRFERREDAFDLPVDEVPDTGVDILQELSREQTIEGVRRAVLSLPESYREAVVLCDLEELSYEDAALALGIPVGTVRSRLSRGRSLLEGKLRARRDGQSAARCGA